MKYLGVFLCFMVIFPCSSFSENMRQRIHQQKPEFTQADVEAEIFFGEEIAARIIGKYSLHENMRLTKYLNLVGKSITQYSNRPELEFTFGILDSDIINAFSTPGGYVFITRGAINNMENEAQLAAVLAHEIIHVTERHIVHELNLKASDSSAMTGFVQIIGGSFDTTRVAFSTLVDSTMKILFERGYKKQDEYEADTKGAILAACAGYSPLQMVKYLNILKKGEENSIAELKKLYPSFEERIALIQKTVDNLGLNSENYFIGGTRFYEYTGEKQ